MSASRSRPRKGLNVFYLGFTHDRRPVRQRDRPPGAGPRHRPRGRSSTRRSRRAPRCATHYTPCDIPFGCAGDAVVRLRSGPGAGDARRGRLPARLRDHHPLPRDADAVPARPAGRGDRAPDPAARQPRHHGQPGRASPTRPSPPTSTPGKLDGHLPRLGQTVTYPDASAFLDPTLRAGRVGGPGQAARRRGQGPRRGPGNGGPGQARSRVRQGQQRDPGPRPDDPARADRLRRRRSAPTSAERRVSPLRQERFATMTPGDRRQLVWLTTGEPPGLYCADETDPVGAADLLPADREPVRLPAGRRAPVPILAERCAPERRPDVWTCTLRSGVHVPRRLALDAGDVVTSFAVQWDAEHPRHLGRTGTFATFAAWFGGFLNPPAAPGRLSRLAGSVGAGRRADRSAGRSGRRRRGRRGRRRGNGRGRSCACDARASGGPSPGLLGRPVDLLGEVAGDLVARVEHAQRRILGHAALRVAELLAQPAAGVEPAARRRVDRRRDVALEDDPAAARLDDRIRDRHGRQQRDRVRVERPDG